MSLATKVAALREFFGFGPDVPLLPAVQLMHAAMGTAPESSLPSQVDTLLQATGVDVGATHIVHNYVYIIDCIFAGGGWLSQA